MSDTRQKLLEHYRTMREELLAAIDGLSDEEMSETTLDGWSVKDHLFHLAFWDEIRVAEVLRISAGYDTAWRTHGEQDAISNALAHDLRSRLSVAQARWEMANTRERFFEAITSATERGLDGSLYGEAGLWSGHEAQHTEWIRRWREERGRT